MCIRDSPKGEFNMKYSLAPVAARLSELLGMDVAMASDVIGEDAKAKAAALKPGEMMLLENVRFHKEEELSLIHILMAGNTTFLICTDDENVDRVISIIADHSKKRKQMVSSSAGYGLGSYTPFPVEVTVGGATIIVTDVQRFEKL